MTELKSDYINDLHKSDRSGWSGYDTPNTIAACACDECNQARRDRGVPTRNWSRAQIVSWGKYQVEAVNFDQIQSIGFGSLANAVKSADKSRGRVVDYDTGNVLYTSPKWADEQAGYNEQIAKREAELKREWS